MRITDKILMATRLPADGPPGAIDLDPQRMTDLNLWKGICGPRSYEWCEKNCDEKKCGYYREAKRRGLDLNAVGKHQADLDVARHRKASLALRKQRAAKRAELARPKTPKKRLKFEEPGKVWK